MEPEKKPAHKKTHSHRKAKSGKKNKSIAIISVIVIILLAAVLLDKFVLKKREVAALVGGEPIYVDQVESTYNKLQNAEKLYMTQGVILGLLIDNKLLLQKAEGTGITVADDELEAMVNAYKSYMPEGNFEKQIGSSKEKLKQFKEELRENLLIQKYLVSQIPGINVSDEEISAFFEQYKQMFSGDMVRVSHILVSTEDEAKPILGRLRDGSDFAALAEENSIDSSAANGGDIGWFGHGATVPEFEDAAFSLKVGEISDIVKTQYGYHLLLVTNRTSVKEPVLDEIKPLLKSSIINQKVKADVAKFMEVLQNLKAEAKIEVLNDFGGTYTPEAGETEEPGETETPPAEATTTTLAPAESCGEQHGLKNGTIIIYYSEDNEKSNEMMANINKLKAQGDMIFKVNRYSEYKDGTKLIIDCYRDVNLQIVPQIICSGTGAARVGLITWEETQQFAEACTK